MGKINKATVAAILGVISTLVVTFVPDTPPDLIAGITTAIVAGFVWAVPNAA